MARADEPKPYTPIEIDDTEDRMGSVHELDFDERLDEREGRVGDERPARTWPASSRPGAWPKAA